MLEIVTTLESEIERLPTGSRLPSEHELMRRFDATRSTVRRAIEQLEGRFLVRRVHGSGTFVNRPVDYLISSQVAPSLHSTIERAGSSARTFLIASDLHPAPAEVAARLCLRAGDDAVRLVRVGYVDDHPATYAEEWIAPGVLEHADVSLRAIESLTAVLRGTRRDPVRAWSRASTAFAPDAVAERLDLRAPTPVWHLETLTRDGGASGEPLLFSRSWMRQDRIRVVIEFEVTPDVAGDVDADVAG